MGSSYQTATTTTTTTTQDYYLIDGSKYNCYLYAYFINGKCAHDMHHLLNDMQLVYNILYESMYYVLYISHGSVIHTFSFHLYLSPSECPFVS